jgi:uncharacterized membrane protein YtjA (UPF0391 family)
MLFWTIAFIVIAGVAGVLGFGVLSASAAGLAQALCYAFAAMAVVGIGLSLFDLRRTA